MRRLLSRPNWLRLVKSNPLSQQLSFFDDCEDLSCPVERASGPQRRHSCRRDWGSHPATLPESASFRKPTLPPIPKKNRQLQRIGFVWSKPPSGTGLLACPFRSSSAAPAARLRRSSPSRSQNWLRSVKPTPLPIPKKNRQLQRIGFVWSNRCQWRTPGGCQKVRPHFFELMAELSPVRWAEMS